ncbi:hypothetical protein FJY69_07855 [candidate division WOR-3 bacterium]|nr:hypothetical protein [candidate division WOR-3 bacterium]
MTLRLTGLAVAALFALTGCKVYDRPPGTPTITGLPATTDLNSTTMVRLYSDAPTGKFISYLVEWGDGVSETTATYVAGDSAEQWHTWHTAGTFTARAKAWYTFDTARFSDWSSGNTIVVSP